MPDRKALLDLLERWKVGELHISEVHEVAEHWSESAPNDLDLSEADPRSIELEVLAQLELANHQLLVHDDIPAFEAFLKAGTGSEEAAWETWRTYWKGVDLPLRRARLKDDPFYVT